MYLPGVPGCTGGKVGRDAREGGELPEYGYWSFVYFFLFATLKAQTLDVIQFLPKAIFNLLIAGQAARHSGF